MNWMKNKQIAIYITDGTHSSVDFEDEGLPFVTTANISGENNSIDLQGSKKVSRNTFENLKSWGCVPRKNDILFSQIGTIGETVIVNTNEEFSILSSLALLRYNLNLVNLEYMKLVLDSDITKKYFDLLMAGGAVKRITLSHIRNMPIYIPSLKDQDGIAKETVSKLNDVSLLISKLTQKLHHLEEYKTALIHNAVTKGLNANGNRILDGTPESEMEWKDSGVEWIGKVPAAASIEQFCHHAEFIKGVSVNRENLEQNSGIRYLRSSDIFEKSSVKKDCLFSKVSDELVLKSKNEYVFCFDGFNSVAGIGTVGLATTYGGEGYIDSHLCLVTSKSSSITKRFLEYWLAGDYFRNFCVYHEKGSISYSAYHAKNQLKVALIDIMEQNAITSYLDNKCKNIDTIKLTIRSKVAKLKEYKKSLINESVTGNI